MFKSPRNPLEVDGSSWFVYDIHTEFGKAAALILSYLLQRTLPSMFSIFHHFLFLLLLLHHNFMLSQASSIYAVFAFA